MKLAVSGKSVSLTLLRYAGIGPTYAPALAFFQGIGDSQAVRAFKYILTKRQSQALELFSPPETWGSVASLPRGNWQVEIKPHVVQGVTMHLLTAYLPFGTWGYNGEWYFFVTPGMPSAHHDRLLRQWANEYTPYPIPPGLSIMALLDKASIDCHGEYENADAEIPVLVGKGKKLGNTPTPWVLAIKPEAFEEVLKEGSYAA